MWTGFFDALSEKRGSEVHEEGCYDEVCYDEVKIERIKFVWKIKDFSKRNRRFTSPLFPTLAPESLGKWRLELNTNHMEDCPPKRNNSSSFSPLTDAFFVLSDPINNQGSFKSGISILLYQETSTVRSANVIFSLMNGQGRVARQESTEYSKAGSHKRLADRNFVLNKNNGLLPKDELTIVCEMEIEVQADPPPCRLAEDLGMLLASKSLSDVTIVVRDIKLRAHKAVLAARSPVFAAMFSNQMLEKETNVVEITDMETDVVQVMLEFIYTGKDVSQTSWAHDLLAAATKYQLERLKFMCEEALCKALSLDNVLENLALADLYSAARLKGRCMSLVMAHRAQILRSPSWETFKLSHQTLAVEILERNA